MKVFAQCVRQFAPIDSRRAGLLDREAGVCRNRIIVRFRCLKNVQRVLAMRFSYASAYFAKS